MSVDEQEIAMAFNTEADDWQVLCVYQFGLGLGLAAEVFVFDFFSARADFTGRFRLYGYGSGLGGKAVGWTLPGLSDWSSLECKHAFSAQQLHDCVATVATASVGVGANIGPCLISGITPTGRMLFEDQDAGGLSGGLSAGAMALAGKWRFKEAVSNRPASYSSTAVA
jgi:hypothetical protein